MSAPSALLALADGTVLRGRSVGAAGEAVGELVFNTAMSGYQEIITDPSYRRQLVTFTCPHIGNVGVNSEDEESAQVHAAALVLREPPSVPSNHRSRQSLGDYLRERGVPAIAGIDTRTLTQRLREGGAVDAYLHCLPPSAELAAAESAALPDDDEAIAAARAFPGLAGMDLAREVSVAEICDWGDSTWTPQGFAAAPPPRRHVVVVDFGVKRNILRLLVAHGCRLTLVPATTPVADILALSPDGVFLSNGPGDPAACTYAIATVRELLAVGMPLFGICLGHQILALAAGARTVKMKFGHHGANHPVRVAADERVLVTSQNHGFAVDEDSLPAVLRATHHSLFDGSLQGVEHSERPAFGFQGHPEASPGPHDADGLFQRFVELMTPRGDGDA